MFVVLIIRFKTFRHLCIRSSVHHPSHQNLQINESILCITYIEYRNIRKYLTYKDYYYAQNTYIIQNWNECTIFKKCLKIINRRELKIKQHIFATLRFKFRFKSQPIVENLPMKTFSHVVSILRETFKEYNRNLS